MSYLKEHVCSICKNAFWARNPKAKYCKICSPLITLAKREESDGAKYRLFERDDFKCVYCGKSPIEDGIRLVLDHVYPYADSKDNSIYNLVTCCNECNMSKAKNHLSIDVYERIIQRNINRNKGISIEKQQEVNKIMEEYFNKQKL